MTFYHSGFLRVSLTTKSWIIVENTTSFDEKFEKDMSDLMRCSNTFWDIQSNSLGGGYGKFSVEVKDKMENISPKSPFLFLASHKITVILQFSITFQSFYQSDPNNFYDKLEKR